MIDECPKSYITPQSRLVIGFHGLNAHTQPGAMLFGPDSSKWPARWADVVAVINVAEKTAKQAVENTRGNGQGR